jgi:long-chain acyl-CoA synthetase
MASDNLAGARARDSSPRFEWILADLAIMSAGAATTTVYANTNAADTGYILGDSESRVVFAENADQVAKLTESRGRLPTLDKVVLFDGSADEDWVITLEDLTELGAKYLAEHPECVRDAIAAITPDRLATLIYTSGTTGRPKGVRLSHQAWVAQLACGFVSAVDGRVDKIVENTAAVKPTFMAAAPRIFEKAHARIVTTAQRQGGPRAKLFEKAVAVGLDVDRSLRSGQQVGLAKSLQHKLFDRLVFSKVRQVFGGRIRFFVFGSAPLNREIAEWFHAAGLLILEGYGLTETAGAGFINRPDHYKLGTVGLPFEGTEVRIGADGKSRFAAPTSWRATTTWPKPPQRPSPKMGGCALETKAVWMTRASSASSAASRTCSKPRVANTLCRRRSRRSSSLCAHTPASSWSSGRLVTSASR